MGKFPWLSRTLIFNAIAMLAEFVAGGQIPLSPAVKVQVVLAINIVLRLLTGQPITLSPTDPAKNTLMG